MLGSGTILSFLPFAKSIFITPALLLMCEISKLIISLTLNPQAYAKNNIDFDIVVASQSLKKTTAYIKISTEMLDDISWIQSEIQNELKRELLKAVEAQAYSGDNTGQNLNGVRTTATAFAAGTLAGTVDSANEVDVINAALTQIKKAQQSLDRAYIFMNPDDVFKLKSYKVSSSDRRYVDMVYMAGDNMRISGVPIIETTLVTTDEYLVGDLEQ